MKAEIWTKPSCHYCVKAKNIFDIKGIPYDEYIIEVSQSIEANNLAPNQHRVSREALLEKAPNAKTVPQIWLDDSYIGGYNELAAFYNIN